MRRYLRTAALAAGLCLAQAGLKAQELFVYTEPASNMAAKSVGLRVSNWFMPNPAPHMPGYQLLPELMLGVNKNLMVHAEGYFSNVKGALSAEGVGLYAKYRFFTTDDVYKHFRMAAFGRFTTNSREIHQEEIKTNGGNGGFELGWIGTQLLHKQAISSSWSFEQVTGGTRKTGQPDKALNYSLSTGRLLLPKNYVSYKQVNFNLMLEVLGQHLLGSSKSYLDIAPAMQFIINSQTRIDIGYRQQLYSTMSRMAKNSFLIRIEHSLFNIL
jgi:hypothetical protein